MASAMNRNHAMPITLPIHASIFPFLLPTPCLICRSARTPVATAAIMPRLRNGMSRESVIMMVISLGTGCRWNSQSRSAVLIRARSPLEKLTIASALVFAGLLIANRFFPSKLPRRASGSGVWMFLCDVGVQDDYPCASPASAASSRVDGAASSRKRAALIRGSSISDMTMATACNKKTTT
jgi:hypothetical protein